MAYYIFVQNNSGGSFDYDEDRGITHFVIIEANTTEQANKRAKDIGLYFDGEDDCPCCGNRWNECEDYDRSEQPEVFGASVLADAPKDRLYWMPGYEVFIHTSDGTIIGYWLNKKKDK